MRLVMFAEVLAKWSVDLVAGLRNSRPDCRNDPAPVTAQHFHRADCAFENTALSPAPSGMRGANHPGFLIREQDRRAVCSDDAKRETAGGGNHRIGDRSTFGCILPRLTPARSQRNDVGRVELMRRLHKRARRNRFSRSRPQAADVLDTSRTTISELVDTARRTEEPVRNALKRGRALNVEISRQGCESLVRTYRATSHPPWLFSPAPLS